MPPLEGVVPTLTPQGIGEGDRPKWHGHRAGGKGGTGTLANIVEHAGGRRGKLAASLPVGGTWCLGAAKRFDWVRSNAWPRSIWLGGGSCT